MHKDLTLEKKKKPLKQAKRVLPSEVAIWKLQSEDEEEEILQQKKEEEFSKSNCKFACFVDVYFKREKQVKC